MHISSALPGDSFKADHQEVYAASLPIDFEKLSFQLERLASSNATALKNSHIPSLLAAVRAGEIKLRLEDLDILERDDRGVHILRIDDNALSIDRNIAHLYFASDGTFGKRREKGKDASQLLHAVGDVIVRTIDGKVICIQWVNKDPHFRNLGIPGGHVPAGMDPAAAAKKEVPEELGWIGKLPKEYALRGNFRIIGSPYQFKAPNPGDAEVKTLGHYFVSDSQELGLVIEEQQHLCALRRQLGDQGFYEDRIALQRTHPGHGEIWAIHILSVEELRDSKRMNALNIGVDLEAYLKEPLVQEALEYPL